MSKHHQNRRKKDRKLADRAAYICTKCGAHKAECCGRVIMSHDSEYHKTVMQFASTAKDIIKQRAALGTSRYGYRKPAKKEFKPPPKEVVEKKFNLQDDDWWRGSPLLRLSEPVHDKFLSPKSGKRKDLGRHVYRMTVLNPSPLPFDEETVTLWHGTSWLAAREILTVGKIRESTEGMLGPGVYLGNTSKAIQYVRTGANLDVGVMFEVEAALGQVVQVKHADDHKKTQADTVHMVGGNYAWVWGGRLRRAEWCVRDASRVQIRSVIVVPPGLKV